MRQAEYLAQALDGAWTQRIPIAPLSASAGIETLEQAYEVQACWHALRERNGDRSAGHKIGLSSTVMQRQFGIDEPDFGRMWVSRQFIPRDGIVAVPVGLFIQPRIETELAVHVQRPLRGPGVTVEQVLESIDAATVAIEIIDSRIADWRITLLDTVSDNASYGGFALGPWEPSLAQQDLRTLEVAIQCGNGDEVRGWGANALGHPAAAVAWLANKLAQFDAEIEAGAIVLTGSLCRALPMQSGDEFVLTVEGKSRFRATFI
jgi:2-keto-4-pentenoate hydratase